MTTSKMNILKNYSSILLLLGGIIIGSLLGLYFGKDVIILKPIGDIFLNFLFTAIIPLIFFTIAASFATLERGNKIGKLFGIMITVFVCTILISAIVMIVAVNIFPIEQNLMIANQAMSEISSGNVGDQMVQLFTVNEFFELLSRKSMLALIIFSSLVGYACLQSGEKGASFKQFLVSGDEVMKNVLGLIMKFAPLGLGAYFAYQVGIFGPQLFGAYAKPLGLYYVTCVFYFFVFFSIYAIIAGGKNAFRIFWKNNIVPSFTAIGTCSSFATIPANLEAADKMNIPSHVSNLAIPFGASLHKDGSSMSSILKIAVLFSMFGKDFKDPSVIIIALLITIIVSIVEGGIPNGGYIGELLIITFYGLPMEQALPVAMILGTLVDPIATLLNANGDVISAMVIARFSDKTKWESAKIEEINL